MQDKPQKKDSAMKKFIGCVIVFAGLFLSVSISIAALKGNYLRTEEVLFWSFPIQIYSASDYFYQPNWLLEIIWRFLFPMSILGAVLFHEYRKNLLWGTLSSSLLFVIAEKILNPGNPISLIVDTLAIGAIIFCTGTIIYKSGSTSRYPRILLLFSFFCSFVTMFPLVIDCGYTQSGLRYYKDFIIMVYILSFVIKHSWQWTTKTKNKINSPKKILAH